MGSGEVGEKRVGPTDPDTAIDQDDLASEIQGRNALHGTDQERFPNQRRTQAGEHHETEGVIESFEKMDPKQRS
jgi:hypothetical protein